MATSPALVAPASPNPLQALSCQQHDLSVERPAKSCVNQLGYRPGPSKHLLVTLTSAIWAPNSPYNFQRSDPHQTTLPLQNPSTNCTELSSKFRRIGPTEPAQQTPGFQNPSLPWRCSIFLKLLNLDTWVSPLHASNLPNLCEQFLIYSVWETQQAPAFMDPKDCDGRVRGGDFCLQFIYLLIFIK